MKAETRIPLATYRLQFNAGFTFRQAADILGYLKELGISDVYASPYFQAGADSQHGYDIADHNQLSPSIGDPADFQIYISALREQKMGQLLDFVPNHMGISEPLNLWWMNVLEDGISSEYAAYFDIDWFSGKKALAEKILLPVLGDRYGKVLESGVFELHYENGAFFITLYDTRLPISPRSYPSLLDLSSAELDAGLKDRLMQISAAFANIRSESEKACAKKKLSELTEEFPAIQEGIKKALFNLQGNVGNPESFDALHKLLEEQVYRLSFWRVAAEEINYRRFFDINTLAAIKVEIPRVFEASHQFIFELLARGDVTGLRIDHVDGLWNPREYFERLQTRYAELCGKEENSTSLYLIVEKILDASVEKLPENWRIHGTTGYEFTNQLTHLFIDSAAETSLGKTYARFADSPLKFSDLVYQKKIQVMSLSFQSEISSLGRQLDDLSEMHRHYRDFTLNTLTSAIREVIACFSVYRTYSSEEHPPGEQEERQVLKAISQARRRNPAVDKSVFDFLRSLLLLRFPENLTPEQREAHRNFVMKFQQCSGPIMAKGLEDTVFYLYNRLIALNEVGGNPGAFGLRISDFHLLNENRFKETPHTLLTTSTHDTKRSEDVRMRIAALTEIPERWRKSVTLWSRQNRNFRSTIDGEKAPSTNEEFLLYQTLIGAWPLDGFANGDREEFVKRIQQYMQKALKEGKVNSSWMEPNEEWETAVSEFVAKILEETNTPFLTDFIKVADEVAYLGALNSLNATVLKCTLPGVPDFYQGTEIWDFSLVDPDNRRAVDYIVRREKLASLLQMSPPALLKDWKNGLIKLSIIKSLLTLRNKVPDFFQEADYQHLRTDGTFADHVVAFSRTYKNQHLLVVATRCLSKIGPSPLGGSWGDTQIHTQSHRWQNILTNDVIDFSGSVTELFSDLPFAVLWREEN